jgi:hypothetical protein
MPQCDSCGKVIKRTKAISCVACKKNFHAVCQSISDEFLRDIEEHNQRWTCNTCNGGPLESQSSCGTSVTSIEQAEPATSPCEPGKSSESLIREVLTKIAELQEDQRELKKSILSWHDTVTEHTRALGEHTKILENIQVMMNNLSDRIDGIMGDNSTLNDRLSDLETQLNVLEQNTLKNTVEIHGIPILNGEVPSAIVCKIGLALGIRIEASDIESSYRIGKVRQNSLNNPPLVVKFARINLADEFVKSRRVKRNLSLSDLDLGISSDKQVYVNESLSPHYRKLFNLAKDLKRNGKLKYLWVRGGRLYARKSDGGEKYIIRNENDIENLK